MPMSVLLVESRPESTQLVDDYSKWRDEVHIPERYFSLVSEAG